MSEGAREEGGKLASRFGIRAAGVVMRGGNGNSEVFLDAVGKGVYFRVTESLGRGTCQ